MSALRTRLESALASRASRQMLRSLVPLAPAERLRLVDFSSNDYLSFAAHPILREKLLRELNDPESPSPFGPPSSRLLDGNSPSHLALEAHVSDFFASEPEGALVFNSGFDANVGVWTCLPGPDDYILYDELVHASIHDGMRSSRVPPAKRIKVRHNGLDDLERTLTEIVSQDRSVRQGDRSVWIGVESLYSMDGDLCPLRNMVELVERLLPCGNGHFIVDEAHSTGLYGEQGRGLVCALGLANRITVRLHTFGKAMACSGAVVLATPLVRQYLVNYARPLIYSTVTPHMNIKAMEKSIEMLQQGYGEQPAKHVHKLASTLIASLSSFLTPSSTVSLPPHLLPPLYDPSNRTLASTHPNLPPTSPIVPLLTSRPRPLSAFLKDRGFLVRPITYPTVPKGMERVRVCLHAANTIHQVEQLARAIEAWEQLQLCSKL
ncbi:aminotransferase class I/II-fold pyridoxal phosphate-dependent enzyme [Sporobolomyces koalae]|uniref:aminotransferase class I/II-fold pyridoxal phosphate-dependent enzyme n=1 Tax=Sporobolomyces koalae TaxID=500713 RepID=UPI00316B36DE